MSSVTHNSFIYTGSVASTFTFNGALGGTSGSVTLHYQRVGDWVTLHIPQCGAAPGTGSTTFTANTAIDAFARPTTSNQQVMMAYTRDNAGGTTAPGRVDISNAGIITIRRDLTGSAYTTSATSNAAGLNADAPITYYVGTGS